MKILLLLLVVVLPGKICAQELVTQLAPTHSCGIVDLDRRAASPVVDAEADNARGARGRLDGKRVGGAGRRLDGRRIAQVGGAGGPEVLPVGDEASPWS